MSRLVSATLRLKNKLSLQHFAKKELSWQKKVVDLLRFVPKVSIQTNSEEVQKKQTKTFISVCKENDSALNVGQKLS